MRIGILALVLWWVAQAALAQCASDLFRGTATVPWDRRDALARQIEAQGAQQALTRDQIARFAFALRLGRDGALALGPGDVALIDSLDAGCRAPPPEPVGAPEPSFGFDLHLGWPQLALSLGFTGLGLGVLLGLGRLRAVARRRGKRYICARQVTCSVGGEPPRQFRMEDVSLTGLRLSLRGADALPKGAAVQVDFGSFQMDGQVIAVGRHLTSVCFARDLTRAELLHLVRPEKYPWPVRQRQLTPRELPAGQG
jgi:hypothetical protein